ncbi:MAG: hypothetical protein AB1659_13985, partial [Thermodesulfobacteriota bacterium]
RENTPSDNYAVARSCGIAVSILNIIRRYNENVRSQHLPVLEIGIGICFQDQAPAFLFDGDRRLMISPAINIADRFSKSSKELKEIIRKYSLPFNLHVFQTDSGSGSSYGSEASVQRYNVNGIELESHAFEKLLKEIRLQTVEIHIPELQKERMKIHTGIFPTAGGRFQRLMIREGIILKVDPATLQLKSETPNIYYEVCTHQKVFQHLQELTRGEEEILKSIQA